MKKILMLFLSGFLVLGACGNNEEDSNQDQDESNKENKQDDEKEKSSQDKNKKDKEDNKDDNNEENNEDNAENDNAQDNVDENEENINVENTQNKETMDFNNIQDVGRLKSIIYGDYTEEQKLEAYKTAVYNGVIPQGNVMEGPASEAYESSMRIANGEEESIYDGLGEVDEEENIEDDGELEAEEEKREQELEDEYFELTHKIIDDDDLSDEEIEKMEERQDEILEESKQFY